MFESKVLCLLFPISGQEKKGRPEKLFLRESLAWRGREQQDFARSARVHACWAGSLRFPGRMGSPWKRPLPGQKSFRQT